MYGNGLNQAAKDVQNVAAGQAPETALGKAGEMIGSAFTPEQIAAQGVIGPAMEASNLGPWAANLMKEWGESAARTAIGAIGKIAKGIGINNLDAIAQFVLKPIKLGTQFFEPIIQATSSPKDMLAAAETVQKAAGTALEKINPVIDEALRKDMSKIDLKGILENLDELKLSVEKYTPKTGKVLVQKFEDAIDDFLQLVKSSVEGENPELFTSLRSLKTTLGRIINDFGSDAPGKVALQKIWGTISQGIDDAAKAANPEISAAFNEANAVYNKITTVIEALEGKVLGSNAKSIFTDIPAIGMGILAGFTNPVAAIPTAIAAHTARNYGPQAIAKGLGVAAPIMPSLVSNAARSLPIVGNAISSALQ
jgi:phage-related protein